MRGIRHLFYARATAVGSGAVAGVLDPDPSFRRNQLFQTAKSGPPASESIFSKPAID